MWGPSFGPTGDPGGLDPSEVLDDVPISLLQWFKILRVVEVVLSDSPPYNSCVMKSFGLAS